MDGRVSGKGEGVGIEARMWIEERVRIEGRGDWGEEVRG